MYSLIAFIMIILGWFVPADHIDPCHLGYPVDQTYYADGTPAPALDCK